MTRTFVLLAIVLLVLTPLSATLIEDFSLMAVLPSAAALKSQCSNGVTGTSGVMTSPEDPLTDEERWATIVNLHLLEPIALYKAPVSADLELAPAPPPTFSGFYAGDFQFNRTVDADAPTPATLATWQAPMPPVNGDGVVSVTYAGQGAAGLTALTGKRIKGIQLVDGLVCNHTQMTKTFAAGIVIEQARASGFQTQSSKVGNAIVMHTVDLNWRNITLSSIKWGTLFAAGLVVPGGPIAASKSIQFALVLAHGLSDTLPSLLNIGAPNPEPYLASVVDESAMVAIAPQSCSRVDFTAAYGKHQPTRVGPVPLPVL